MTEKDHIKYRKEVDMICKSIEPRLIHIWKKIEKGDINLASGPAFWIGLESDIDDELKKIFRSWKHKHSVNADSTN